MSTAVLSAAEQWPALNTKTIDSTNPSSDASPMSSSPASPSLLARIQAKRASAGQVTPSAWSQRLSSLTSVNTANPSPSSRARPLSTTTDNITTTDTNAVPQSTSSRMSVSELDVPADSASPSTSTIASISLSGGDSDESINVTELKDSVTPKNQNLVAVAASASKPYEPSPSWCARPLMNRRGSVGTLWKRPSPAMKPRGLLRHAANLPQFPSFMPPSPASRLQYDTNSENPQWPSLLSANSSPRSTPRSGLASPSLLSPGPGIRRLAEQFLASLPDDSPAHGKRTLSHTENGTISLRALVLNRAALTSTSPSSVNASADEAHWCQLHDEILEFAVQIAQDSEADYKLRDDLVARTRWSIRAVWPQAEVDLVGSVAASVALPKSDLDFVVWFPPSNSEPIANSWITATPTPVIPSLPFVPLDRDGGSGGGGGGEFDKSQSLSMVTQSPLSTASTISNTDTDSVASQSSFTSSFSSSLSSSLPLYQYFAHAGSLIKLIGGRKKSKLLFRSTKIQVFKDINLIRLRDGIHGHSMDLWFPADLITIQRSQKHTLILQSFLQQFPPLYALSIVVKTMMTQNCLNSGYSGLGSYGIELMLVRYLQSQRTNGKENESNVGKLLYGFFHFYSTEFDYATKAITVNGEGGFIDKPELKQSASGDQMYGIAHKREKLKQSQGKRTNEDNDDSDGNDDAEANNLSADDNSSALENDTLTLIIQDPSDDNNQIVCHAKALRNMIGAFERACSIIRPKTSHTDTDTASESAKDESGESTATTVASTPVTSTATSVAVSAYVTPTSTAPASPSLSTKGPEGTVLPMSLTETDTGTAADSDNSAFHRLIDAATARLGPSMKPCPSQLCQSENLVPVQNKSCFACGHTFTMEKTSKGKHTNNIQVTANSNTVSISGGPSRSRKNNRSNKNKVVKTGANGEEVHGTEIPNTNGMKFIMKKPVNFQYHGHRKILPSGSGYHQQHSPSMDYAQAPHQYAMQPPPFNLVYGAPVTVPMPYGASLPYSYAQSPMPYVADYSNKRGSGRRQQPQANYYEQPVNYFPPAVAAAPYYASPPRY